VNYQNYVTSRDWAWKKLIEHRVNRLPIKISNICRAEGITIISYSDANNMPLFDRWRETSLRSDGFAITTSCGKLIFYNDACALGRQRFTVAHEYGHFVLGYVSSTPTQRNHDPAISDDSNETMANIVASRLLSPACVLRGLGVRTADEIAELCRISQQAAEWRALRLEALYERERKFLRSYGYSCFLLSDLEKQVFNQFKDYIQEVKDQRACP
jgi:Zn-dependent peptidase ImmA (M78 family)